MDNSTARVVRTRLMSRVASSEWPPSSKKLSSRPTREVCRTSPNSVHRISSSGVRGARQLAEARSGAGSAFRSSFPFNVRGKASNTTKTEGVI